ncbi:MAG: transposase family protein [Microscillaceae bacterium]|nr:transposase family protein [Microscillaceae bacterium]
MRLDIKGLKSERQWRSATGFSQAQFEVLVSFFKASYESIYGKSIEERTSESPNHPTITQYNELLLFTLFSLKSGLTYDLLGFVSGMNGSNAKRNQGLGLEVLQDALAKLGLLPKRNFETVEDFNAYFKEHKKLIFDATEQRIQRPKDKEAQKESFSGKKSAIPSKQ